MFNNYFIDSVDPVVDEMMRILEPQVQAIRGASWLMRKREEKRRALRNLCVNLNQCLFCDDEPGILAVSRDRNFYRAGNGYTDGHFAYRTYVPLFDVLVLTGVCKEQRGYFDRDAGSGRTTRLIPNPKIFGREPISPASFVNLFDEPIVLRGYGECPSNYPETDFTKNARERLVTYNEFIGGHEIALLPESCRPLTGLTDEGLKLLAKLKDEDKRRWRQTRRKLNTERDGQLSFPFGGEAEEQDLNPTTTQPHYLERSFSSSEYRELGLIADVRCRRIFNGSFENGGRFYAPYQNLPRNERERLLIDGETVCELDYSALHPTLLYHESKLESPGSPYAVFVDERDRSLRHVVKAAMLRMINLNGRRGFSAAMTSWWETDGRRSWMPKRLNDYLAGFDTSIANLRSRIEKVHAPIASCFFRQLGLKLQFTDSEIMDEILHRCTAAGIPVLPIHDSVVAPSSRKSDVEAIMHATYADRMGFPIKVDPRYCH
ncbi:MAG: hypothetical protein M5R36_28360 [Deltaproteobacteria bacterium]|nr:hypothetical protein [Deltaproteobacteria bacterium]